MLLELIEEDKKAIVLEFILEEYAKAGFCTLSKSDIDLIIFSALWQFSNQLKEKSDYQISKKLQITQSKVRNLKEKMALKYKTCDREKAIEYLSEQIEYAKYDKNETKMIIPIRDINVFREIENIIEEDLNGLVDTQLNSKALKISINDFFELVFLSNDNDKDNVKNEIINKVKNKVKKEKKYQNELESINKFSDVGTFLLKQCGKELATQIVSDLIPGGGTLSLLAKKAIEHFSKN